MKKVKMVQVLFILICLIGYGVTAAQSDYVVTTKNDTLKGKVKYLNFNVEKKVQLNSPTGKKTVYAMLQLKAFNMDGEIYHPVRTSQGYTYMKLLKYGYLSLYSFQVANQTTWNGTYLLKKDGTGIEIPTLTFKKALNRFLSDCPTVTKGIESGDLGRNDVNTIVDEYNNCISANTKNQSLTQTPQQTQQISAWDSLEKEVTALQEFDGKSSALEMIIEIKSKIRKEEKVPKFLLDGIKNSLKDQSSVASTLEKALLEIKN